MSRSMSAISLMEGQKLPWYVESLDEYRTSILSLLKLALFSPRQIRLDYLHEPGILSNLSKRFSENHIYTYSGSILISVNPYKKLPLYGDKQLKMYHDTPLGELPPHVFALADEAFRLMLVESKTQSILISGESGAGKTEAAKQVMNFLASKVSMLT